MHARLAKLWDRYRRIPKSVKWVGWIVLVLGGIWVVEDLRGRFLLAHYTHKWDAQGIVPKWDGQIGEVTPEGDFLETPVMKEWLEAEEKGATRIGQIQLAYGELLETYEDVGGGYGLDFLSSTWRDQDLELDLQEVARHVIATLKPQEENLEAVYLAATSGGSFCVETTETLSEFIFVPKSLRLYLQLLNSIADAYWALAMASVQLGDSEAAVAYAGKMMAVGSPIPVLPWSNGNWDRGRFRMLEQVILEGQNKSDFWSMRDLANLESMLERIDLSNSYILALRKQIAHSNAVLANSYRGELREFWIENRPAAYGFGSYLRRGRDLLTPRGGYYTSSLLLNQSIVEKWIVPGVGRSMALDVEKIDLLRASLRKSFPAFHFRPVLVTHTFSDIYHCEQLLEAQQRLDFARIAIALERWKLVHGSYPDKLTRLIPHYLPGIPLDRFDPTRFIVYETTNEGRFRLLACGRDRDFDGNRSGFFSTYNRDVVWEFPESEATP